MTDDLISRQEAIDANCTDWCFRKYSECPYFDNVGTDEKQCDGCDTVLILKDLPSAQQWIPVTERLPEEDGKYLVCGNDKIWICRFMCLDGVHGWSNDAWNPRVEAWMPLPKPWKGEV